MLPADVRLPCPSLPHKLARTGCFCPGDTAKMPPASSSGWLEGPWGKDAQKSRPSVAPYFPTCYKKRHFLRQIRLAARRISMENTEERCPKRKTGKGLCPSLSVQSCSLRRRFCPACPGSYPSPPLVRARLWNFTLSTTTRSWVPSPMGPTSS